MPRFPIEVMKRQAAAILRKDKVARPKSPANKANRLDSPSKASLLSLATSSSSWLEFDIEPEPVVKPEPEPLELVYNIRYDAFRQAPRSTVLRQNISCTPLIDLPVTCPPLLVDGRMQIVQVPRWTREVGFYWRSWNGAQTEVRWKSVRLPRKIWVERNFGERKKWTELWVERA